MIIKMILTNAFDPDVRVYKEALYLTRKGHVVEIICWDRNGNESPYPQDEDVDGIKITRFRIKSIPGTGMKQLPAFLHFIKETKNYLENINYDYLHCHDFDGRIVGFFANVSKKPIVFDMHEFYESGTATKRKIYRMAVMHFIKTSKAALYENDIYTKKPYNKYIEKLYSLKNYPDRGMIIPLPKTESKEFRIGYHGAVRNQIPYFKALFEAASKCTNVRVDVNGGGIDYKQLLEISKQYKNVHVNGPYNGAKESSILYANTDVLFCGYNKMIPNHQKDAEAVKFFEAIITGTPMIMQAHIGMGDKVEREGYGIAVETDSAEQIEKAIHTFIENRDFYEKCKNNELRNANRYNWENEVKVLDIIYS